MKTWNLILLLLIITSCQKEKVKNVGDMVTVKIENPLNGELIDGFTYKVEASGIAGVNSKTTHGGPITNGYTSFQDESEIGRVHVLTVDNENVPGHFQNNINSGNINTEQKHFVFYFYAEKGRPRGLHGR